MTFKGKRRNVLDVCARPCSECLFSSAKIVSDERKTQLLKQMEENDRPFTCHKHSIEGRDVICHGDYSRDPRRTPAMRLAQLLGLVRLIDEDGRETDRTSQTSGSSVKRDRL